MNFINWFMGNALIWVFIFLIVVDLVIMAFIAWLMYQDWRWRK